MKKIALLIGVNDYKHESEIGALRGCVNDTKIMARVLKRRFGFAKEDITFLWNEEATRDSIIKELKRIVENCESNDTIVFYFSGHGTRRIAREANKPDNLDETIMPYDTRFESAIHRDIRDSELRNWMALLMEKAADVHLFLDCCHSGSLVRGGEDGRNGRKNKGIDTDRRREISSTSVESPAPPQRSNPDAFPAPLVDWQSLSNFYSLLSACRRDEPAKEFPVTRDGKYHGVFTYFLVRELEQASENFTYQDVFEQLCIKIKAKSFMQSPQIEGNAARQLFSRVEAEAMKYVLVEKRSQNKAVLSAGAVHGVTTKSEWAVYPPQTKYPSPENKIGNVVIAGIDVITSDAKITQESKIHKISEGCRAVEEIHYYDEQKKSVYIDSPLSELRQIQMSELRQIQKNLAKDIKASSWLKLAETKDEADFLVSLSMNSPANDLHVEILQDGEEPFLLKMSNLDDGAPETIRRNLEKLTKYSMILELENPSSDLKDSVEFTLLQQVGKNWREAEPVYKNLPKYAEGEQIAFQIINKSSSQIYVSVLDFGLTKRISLLYPQRAASQKLASTSAARKINPEIGILKKGLLPVPNDTIILTIPNEAFITELPELNTKGGIEVFKLIVTSQETNFSFIEQTGLKTREKPETALERLIFKYSNETRTREAGFKINEQGDWFTINRGFYLCRT
jgi:hypothetical protein